MNYAFWIHIKRAFEGLNAKLSEVTVLVPEIPKSIIADAKTY